MAHKPDFVWDGEFWDDENQPDSDQFSGTSDEWLALLAERGIRPPVAHHADPELAEYPPFMVFVSMEVGTVYRIGGDTLAVFDQHHARAFAGRHRAVS